MTRCRVATQRKRGQPSTTTTRDPRKPSKSFPMLRFFLGRRSSARPLLIRRADGNRRKTAPREFSDRSSARISGAQAASTPLSATESEKTGFRLGAVGAHGWENGRCAPPPDGRTAREGLSSWSLKFPIAWPNEANPRFGIHFLTHGSALPPICTRKCSISARLASFRNIQLLAQIAANAQLAINVRKNAIIPKRCRRRTPSRSPLSHRTSITDEATTLKLNRSDGLENAT